MKWTYLLLSSFNSCSTGVLEGDASFTDHCAMDVARVLVSVTDGVVPVRLRNVVTLYSGTHVGTY